MQGKDNKGKFEVWKGEWRGEVFTVHKITPGIETSFNLLDKCAFVKSIEHENHIRLLAVHMNSEPFLVASREWKLERVFAKQR